MAKAKRRPQTKIAPRCLSLVVADEVRHERNGKLLVVGAYTDVTLTRAAEPAPLTIWATITGVPAGDHDIEIAVYDLGGKKKMRPGKDIFQSPGEGTVGHVFILLEEFKFPTSGTYIFRILLDDQRIGEQVVRLEFPSSEASAAA